MSIFPRINYEDDVLKHYVRRYGWLPAYHNRRFHRRIRGSPLRYFTFCAASAIDVFMLLRDNILSRNADTGRIEGVYFAEADDESFQTISGLIGTIEQGFRGSFQKIVLFVDDEDTQGKLITDEDDEPFEKDLRKKLQLKDTHIRLKESFPFDIINFDVCGTIIPSGPTIISDLLDSLIKILEWQSNSRYPNNNPCDQFTLFFTTHLDPNPGITNQQAVNELINLLNENISQHTQFAQIYNQKYSFNPENLSRENFSEFFTISFPKYVIKRVMFELGWNVTYDKLFLYNRSDVHNPNNYYQIMHSVSIFTRSRGLRNSLDNPSIASYLSEITNLLNQDIEWVDEKLNREHNTRSELERDLREIINFRDRNR